MPNGHAGPPLKPCYAAWCKDDGTASEYWEWDFDEATGQYVSEDSEEPVAPALLLSMMRANVDRGLHIVPRQVANDKYEASL